MHFYAFIYLFILTLICRNSQNVYIYICIVFNVCNTKRLFKFHYFHWFQLRLYKYEFT